MSRKNKLENLYRQKIAQRPEETIVVCPNCKSTSTVIEKWVEKYPYIRCLKCNIAFYIQEFRSACTYWKQSITQDHCKACFQHNPIIQCKYWNGVLPPPTELAKALKIQMEKKALAKIFSASKKSYQ